jgi:hypothetical protein
MTLTIYGLTQSGNRYYYAMGNQALVVQVEPFPAAWRKTPSTSWKRAHGQLQLLRLDMLGLGILELDPLANFDRSSVNVFRLVPSTGQFEYEPDWSDVIPFDDWTDKSNWREIVSDLMSQIDPGILTKLRQFSHFHWSLLEALVAWPGFSDLLDRNPALAVCLAGRLRVGAQEGERRSRLNYRNLVGRSEREIAAAVGFGDSEEVVSILRKVVPDVCKPLDLVGFYDLMENPVIKNALLETDVITYPALLLLGNRHLGPHLTGGFLSDFANTFPHSLDILTCPWGPLLRGGGKGDRFTWKYQQALDVVQFAGDPTINSIEDLEEKHSKIFMKAFTARYHK